MISWITGSEPTRCYWRLHKLQLQMFELAHDKCYICFIFITGLHPTQPANNTSSIAKEPHLETVTQRWTDFCSGRPHKEHRRPWIGEIFTVFSEGQRSSLLNTPSFFLSQCKHHNTCKVVSATLRLLLTRCIVLCALLTLRKVAAALNKAAVQFFSLQTRDRWQNGPSPRLDDV